VGTILTVLDDNTKRDTWCYQAVLISTQHVYWRTIVSLKFNNAQFRLKSFTIYSSFTTSSVSVVTKICSLLWKMCVFWMTTSANVTDNIYKLFKLDKLMCNDWIDVFLKLHTISLLLLTIYLSVKTHDKFLVQKCAIQVKQYTVHQRPYYPVTDWKM